MRQRSLKALTTIGLLALLMLASEARQLPDAAKSSAAVVQLLDASQQNLARLANASSGLGQNLDITV